MRGTITIPRMLTSSMILAFECGSEAISRHVRYIMFRSGLCILGLPPSNFSSLLDLRFLIGASVIESSNT